MSWTGVNDDCKNCGNWDGWFDLYAITVEAIGPDPCGEGRRAGWGFGWDQEEEDRIYIRWSCVEATLPMPILDYALCEDDGNHLAGSGVGTWWLAEPESTRFLFHTVTATWGHDFDQESSHEVVAKVAGKERANLIGGTEDETTGRYVVERDLNGDEITTRFLAEEARVRIVGTWEAPRSDAGQYAQVAFSCHGTGITPSEVQYRLWLTNVQLTRGVGEVTVGFDPYQPSDGHFERYEVYVKEWGQPGDFALGASTTTQSASSLTVQNLRCDTKYWFFARIVWSGQGWANDYSNSHLHSVQPRCGFLGIVEDQASGARISGAPVRATGTGGEGTFQTSTNVYGEYWLPVEFGAYTLEAWRCDYQLASVTRTTDVAGWTLQNFQLQKKPTGTLWGYVTDANDGSAISGATVRELTCNWSTTTNSNGYYSFTVIAAESISVRASASGYDSKTKSTTVPAGGSSQLNFDLTPSSGGGGGSPFVAPWNGTDYARDNNILPKSGDWAREEPNVDDYYRLHQPLLPKDGTYSLRVLEFEDEHTRLDRLTLFAVDHDSDVRVAVDREGRVLTFEDPESPVYAVDTYGRDQLAVLANEDGVYYQGWRQDSVTVGFGHVPRAAAKLLLLADACNPCKMSVVVHVLVEGEWQYVDTVYERMHFAWEVVDLSPYAPSENLTVRLSTTKHHLIDFVGLDTSPHREVVVQEAPLLTAVHSEDVPVLGLLQEEDGEYVHIVPGQHVTLEFDIPPMLDEARSFVLVSEGWYTHTYQPYVGEDLTFDGLTVEGVAVLAQETEVFFWDVDIVSLVWHLGDGTVVEGWSFVHTYAEPGEYAIAVEIHYENGHMLVAERRMSVQE